MVDKNNQTTFIFRSFVNSFAYLYQDAEYFHQVADRPELANSFEQVRLCRTALLLYIFSLEGLINRALDHFIPQHLRDFIMEREDRFRIEEKWLLLPLLVSEKETFDKSKYPWSHFSELVSIRNDFVHPKHDRPAYYKAITSHEWTALKWNEIPKGSKIKESEVVYRQTRIPRDPYALRPEHMDTVKKIVDDTVAELDRLLGGKITENNWFRSDQMTLIFPPNAKLDDLASLPVKKKAG
jgi:hypothetical protein